MKFYYSYPIKINLKFPCQLSFYKYTLSESKFTGKEKPEHGNKCLVLT